MTNIVFVNQGGSKRKKNFHGRGEEQGMTTEEKRQAIKDYWFERFPDADKEQFDGLSEKIINLCFVSLQPLINAINKIKEDANKNN